jgi:hypothetical protein
MSKNDLPSPEYLRQRLSYDPETGRLYWRYHEKMPTRWNSRWTGVAAGRISQCGYNQVAIYGIRYPSHRIIWAMSYGAWPNGEIDHIDGNRLNNRLGNLRDVSRTENSRNMALRHDSTSGITGVCWDKNRSKWIAQIRVNRIRLNLGRFNSFEEAIAARKAAEIEFAFHQNHGRSAVAAERVS